MKCIDGRGSLEDIRGLLEKYLGETRRRFRIEEKGNRIWVYRLGFLNKFILIYNFSDGTFKLCGSRRIIKEIKKYKLIYGLRVDFFEELPSKIVSPRRFSTAIEEEVYSLLLEKQRIESKYRLCRLDVKLTAVFTILVFTISYLFWRNLVDSVYSAIFFLVFMLALPRIMLIDRRYTVYMVPLCLRYRFRLKEVVDELVEKNRLLPENSPLRKIVHLQVREYINQ